MIIHCIHLKKPECNSAISDTLCNCSYRIFTVIPRTTVLVEAGDVLGYHYPTPPPSPAPMPWKLEPTMTPSSIMAFMM